MRAAVTRQTQSTHTKTVHPPACPLSKHLTLCPDSTSHTQIRLPADPIYTYQPHPTSALTIHACPPAISSLNPARPHTRILPSQPPRQHSERIRLCFSLQLALLRCPMPGRIVPPPRRSERRSESSPPRRHCSGNLLQHPLLQRSISWRRTHPLRRHRQNYHQQH